MSNFGWSQRHVFGDEVERRMLANDPTVTYVQVDLQAYDTTKPFYHDMAARVSLALPQTTHIRKLAVSLDMFKREETSEEDCKVSDDPILPLITWIVESPTLEEFDLLGNCCDVRGIDAELYGLFLFAIISRRVPLRYLKLYHLDLDVGLFVDVLHQCPTLSALVLDHCWIGSTTVRQSDCSVRVGVAISQHLCIKALEFCWTQKNAYCFNGILVGIQEHFWLEDLVLSCPTSESAKFSTFHEQRNIMRLFTEGCGPSQSIRWTGLTWTPRLLEEWMEALELGVSETKEIGFSFCRFDANSFGPLKRLFDEDVCMEKGAGKHDVCEEEDDDDDVKLSSFERLWLGGGNRIADVDELKTLVGTAPCLQHVTVQATNTILPGKKNVLAVVQGLTLTTCRVNRLVLDCRGCGPALAASLPYWRSVTQLELSFSPKDKIKLLNATKRNSSLVTITVRDGALTPEEHVRLQSYATRNAQLAPLSQGGATKDVLLVPYLLRASVESTQAVELDCARLLGALVHWSDKIGAP